MQNSASWKTKFQPAKWNSDSTNCCSEICSRKSFNHRTIEIREWCLHPKTQQQESNPNRFQLYGNMWFFRQCLNVIMKTFTAKYHTNVKRPSTRFYSASLTKKKIERNFFIRSNFSHIYDQSNPNNIPVWKVGAWN